MPVVKVKELPIYQNLLDAVWTMRFQVPLAQDPNLIENRKALRVEIARRFGLYAGEFDSKRFEDIFNGIRNTRYCPDDIAESSIPVSNYPGTELLEAYCYLYYQLEAPDNPGAFKDLAKAGANWQRFQQEYYSQLAPPQSMLSQATAAQATLPHTPKDFRVWGLNLCSARQVMLASAAVLSLVWLLGGCVYLLIRAQYLLPAGQAAGQLPVEVSQKGYFLSLAISSLMQSLIILALLVVYHYDEDLGGAHYIDRLPQGIIRTTLGQFQGGWLAIWMSLLFLYGWFAFKWGIESYFLGLLEGHPQDAAPSLKAMYLQFRAVSWAIADLFNLMGAVLYFYLYFILDTESIATEQDPADGPARNAFFVRIIRVVLLLAVALLAGAVTDRLVDLGDYQGLPVLLYSLFTCIAMAMFFGRLNSHFFNTAPAARIFFVPLFYLYAALQAVYAMLGFRNVHISVSIIMMVFVLKIMLFFYISKLINKRRFDRYITQMLRQFGNGDRPDTY